MFNELQRSDGTIVIKVVSKKEKIENLNLSKDDFLFINCDGFHPKLDEKEPYIRFNHVFFFNDGNAFYYFPKNDECDKTFVEWVINTSPSLKPVKITSFESVVLVKSFIDIQHIFQNSLYIQMMNAYPNNDISELRKVIGFDQEFSPDRNPCIDIMANALRKDELKSIKTMYHIFDDFSSYIAQKIKNGPCGIIGVTSFSKDVSNIIGNRMLTDVYDKDLTVDQLREISKDSTGNLDLILRRSKTLVVVKDYDIDFSKLKDVKIIGLPCVLKEQTPNMKMIGYKGWSIG